MTKKKILFLTGTRADYGKLKSLMKQVDSHPDFELYVFITGMHMLSKYGSTHHEVEKDGFKNIYKYINQRDNSDMDVALSNTIIGLSNYISEIEPDMIVIHGDRLEALAGAIVGAFNNIKVAHIEGGEVSGTIDESIRHAITKFSHIHFVANDEAKNRVKQLGENEEAIFVIGSPDIDIMYSEELPSIENAKVRYGIPFDQYAIIMYHPVTTQIDSVAANVKAVVDAVIESGRKYVVIYPNNDNGTQIILNEYKRFEGSENFKVYPSIRFEYFLTLLKNADFIIGNSSAGIREAGAYGVASINIGNRQEGRALENSAKSIINVPEDSLAIGQAIKKSLSCQFEPISYFGEGNSDKRFMDALAKPYIWNNEFQKKFVDLNFGADNYV